MKYIAGDIVRESGGAEWLVIEDEGTDKGGQILMRPLGEPVYLTRTGKPGRFRRIARRPAAPNCQEST